MPSVFSSVRSGLPVPFTTKLLESSTSPFSLFSFLASVPHSPPSFSFWKSECSVSWSLLVPSHYSFPPLTHGRWETHQFYKPSVLCERQIRRYIWARGDQVRNALLGCKAVPEWVWQEYPAAWSFGEGPISVDPNFSRWEEDCGRMEGQKLDA